MIGSVSTKVTLGASVTALEMEILFMVDHFVGTQVYLATLLLYPMSLFNNWCLINVSVFIHYNITSSLALKDESFCEDLSICGYRPAISKELV